MLVGGISSGKLTGRGTVIVEPIARITAAGQWLSIPCSSGRPTDCKTFEREYLNKPHIYTVVGADGRGAAVHTPPTKLDECYGYTEKGTYSGASVARSTVAASSTDFFAEASPPLLLDSSASSPIHRSLALVVPAELDSTQYLQFFTLELEGLQLVVVQRSFADYVGKPEEDTLKHVFLIGIMSEGHFGILHRMKNVEDEEERVVGVIRLKSGRDFLITTVNDSESQRFRIYGIKDGKLAIAYSGGGSSC
jgi:hypothetical protein